MATFSKESYTDRFFENHIYVFKYDAIIRNLILHYKFNEKPYLYKSFTEFLKNYQKECLLFDFYDIIVPVPISKKRLKRRGYNQSYLIAKEIAKILNCRLEKNSLLKEKDNIAQSTLNQKDREENVKCVYKVINKENIENKKILLIDDIFTTGSTVNECSKVLKSAGAKKVDIFTIAKD